MTGAGDHPIKGWLEIRDVLGTPYPPYVSTTDQKLRWNWCGLVAAGVSMDPCPEDPAMRSSFIVTAIRTYYEEPTLTCGDEEREQFEANLAEARRLGIVPQESDFY